jgi:3-hydroxyisobutyrate dehydrogenase
MSSTNGHTDGQPSAAKVETIGYAGLGNAGYPLASTLSRAGYRLVVRDADHTRAERFASEHKNATAAAANDDAAFKEVDILVTMLPNGSIVQDVLLSLAQTHNLKDNAILIDTSSSSPFHTRETASLLHSINPSLTLIDSPITQAYAFALAKGDATLMVGCSNPLALERAMPVLKTLGKHVFVMGDLGSGHVMKTLNNYTGAASILGLCDALVAGQKFGLKPQQMVEVMNVGTGGNFSTRDSFRTEVSPLTIIDIPPDPRGG